MFFHTPAAVVPSDAVLFDLPDGTSLTVGEGDLRRVYQALWDLIDLPGAVSTAAMILHESRQSALFRQPVELTVAQGDALRQALARLAHPPS